MKTILLLRHAKSSWKHSGLSDHERPLNKRGKADAPRMAQLLIEQGLVPDRIIASTAKRTRKTAEVVAEACGREADLVRTDEFYLASPAAYIRELRGLNDEVQCVLVVGHNPGLEELVESLTGHDERMPTCALAYVQVDISSWEDLSIEGGCAKLQSIWRPRDLHG